MLIFCQVHVQRNFSKKFPNHEFRHELAERLCTTATQEELLRRMDGICETWPELTSWIRNKRAPWVLSGLSKGVSKVTPEYWVFARKHTGISESSHFEDNNFTGRKTSLLNAVSK